MGVGFSGLGVRVSAFFCPLQEAHGGMRCHGHCVRPWLKVDL